MNTWDDKIINMKKDNMKNKLKACFDYIKSNSVPEICDVCEFGTNPIVRWKFIGHKRMCECTLLQDTIDGDNPCCAVYDFIKFIMERI